MTQNPIPPSPPLPPGSFGLPIVGETPEFLREPDFILRRYRRYGPIFKTHILGRPTVVLCGPQGNRFLLASHEDYFSWPQGWPRTFKELLGRSLFLMEGAEHRRNRKLLMPAFHGPALANYATTMTAICDRYLQRWETLGQFTWLSELKEMTFDIASTLLIGNQPGPLTRQLSHWFSQLTNGLFTLPLSWPGTPYHKALRARDNLLAHIENTIKQRQNQPTQDALGLLVASRDEAGDRLSLAEIKVQALLMLFAGHETTTSMLANLALALAQHPAVLAQLRAEQAPFANAAPTPDQLKSMPYLDRVLKEVERCYPPIGGGFRGVVKPFVFNGYAVPSGWLATYSISATHQDGSVYSDPQTFNPDRFLAQEKLPDYSLVGFGGGSRFCLGYAFAQMEMKLFAALLLRRYHWELLPRQDLRQVAIPSLHPRSGLKVRFRKL